MTRPRRTAAGAGTVVVLLLFVIPPLPAQEAETPPPGPDEVEDSLGLSALDEQFAGSGEGDELEREAPPAGRRRRDEGWRLRWRLRATGLLQEPAGHAEGIYAGDRLKTSQRLLVRKGEAFRSGILTDKDPGERSHADFVSGVVSFGGLPFGSTMTLGDFRVRAGQGMLFGSARSFGKGAAVIEPALRDAWGLPDGLSSDETHFFRGAAVESAAGPVSLLFFGSIRQLSARLTGDGRFAGIDESGYHRTGTEIGRRGSATDRAFGGAIRWKAGDRLSAGVNVLRSALSLREGGGPAAFPPVVRRASADLRLGIASLTLFCEVVAGESRPPWIAGALFAPSGNARVVIVRRALPDAPDRLRTFGFADGSTGRNEAGTYVGVEMVPARALTVGGYLDLHSRVAPVGGAVHPPAGVDRLVSIGWEPERGFGVEARFRSRDAEVTADPVENGSPAPPRNVVRSERSLRAGVRWNPAGGVECRARAEYSRSSFADGGDRAQGGMIYAGLGLEPARGVSVQYRLSLFAAGSRDTRIYSAEPDLPGTLTNTALTGEGTRWYLICSIRVSGHLRCTVKFSRLRQEDLSRIGSGPSELPSNVAERAGIQLDLTL